MLPGVLRFAVQCDPRFAWIRIAYFIFDLDFLQNAQFIAVIAIGKGYFIIDLVHGRLFDAGAKDLLLFVALLFGLVADLREIDKRIDPEDLGKRLVQIVEDIHRPGKRADDQCVENVKTDHLDLRGIDLIDQPAIDPVDG